MSLASEIKQQFFVASKNDPSLAERPTVVVKAKVLEQVFAPMRNLMSSDVAFKNTDIKISDQIAYLRQICLEAQLAYKTTDEDLKKDREKLLNTLQSMMERVKEAEDA